MSQSLYRIRVGWIALALLALLGTACGDKDDGAGTASDATIVSFTVEPESIVEGEAALLRWSVTKAKQIRLLAEGIRLGSADLPAEGELEVWPTKDTNHQHMAVVVPGRHVRA